MKYVEFKKLIYDLIPNASVEVDDEGQIIIYTDKQLKDGDVVKFELPDTIASWGILGDI